MGDFQRAGSRHDLTGRQVAVSNNLAMTPVIDTAGMLFNERFHFVLRGGVKHLRGPFVDQLIQRALTALST